MDLADRPLPGVYNPALSKLLGGQKGSPHTEAFQTHNLARCQSFSGLSQVSAGVILLQPTGLGAHCMPDSHSPALVRYFPHIWMRQVFPTSTWY